jgi:hypothetical protein
MRRTLKHLTIAFRTLCGLAAVLLCVLWVRSFWVTDLVSKINDQRIATTIGSQYGAVYLAHFDAEIGYRHSNNSSAPRPWAFTSVMGYTSNDGLFVWSRRQTSLYAALPHWVFAMVTMMVGACSWLPWRFSLRTLLLGMTLVALVLGAVIYLTRMPPPLPPVNVGDYPDSLRTDFTH